MPHHQPKDSPDGRIEFCTACGNLLAARRVADVPWVYSALVDQPCDAQLVRIVRFRSSVESTNLLRLRSPR